MLGSKTTIRWGLPPCIRGNPCRAARHARAAGSTPVHTGKPLLALAVYRPAEVYPRAYGETIALCRLDQCNKGLPPCIRGNPRDLCCRLRIWWSTPVHTGKPAPARGRRLSPRVYPRAYGETGGQGDGNSSTKGLPPCIRGNHDEVEDRFWPARSTPVHTGKPLRNRHADAVCEVYPRAYGETQQNERPGRYEVGLPPCIRGNPATIWSNRISARSTPVHTGKPRSIRDT